MGLPKVNWRRSIVVGGVLLGATSLAGLWFGADHLAGRIYRQWRPDLERQIGRGLGHPLQLGPYRGLRPWGLLIGPSRISPSAKDGSRASLQSLEVSIAPLASLRRRLPVLQLGVGGGDLQLVRNASGRFWVFGGGAAGKPPRLDLAIRLTDRARVRVEPFGLDLAVEGGLSVKLDRSQVDWQGLAQLPPAAGSESPGRFQLGGGANWDTGDLRLQLGIREQPLAPLARFWPDLRSSTDLSGRLAGRLVLARQGGRQRCDGSLRLQDLRLRDRLLPAPLNLEWLALRCSGDRLDLASSPWSMANWRGSARGALALNRWFDLKLTAADPKRGDRLGLALRGAWNRPRLELTGLIPLGRGTPASPEPLRMAGEIQVDRRKGLSLQLAQLQLNSGRSQLQARGMLWPRLDLRSRSLELHPSLWRSAAWLRPLLGAEQWVEGQLALSGAWADPRLRGLFTQGRRPLLEIEARRSGATGLSAALRAPAGLRLNQAAVLGPASASLLWRDNLLRLEDLRSVELQASGLLPLRWQNRRGLVAGDLALELEAAPFQLQRLSPLVGVQLGGDLAASGSLRGPLARLRPDLEITLRNPASGPLRLQETWRGRLIGQLGSGGELRMTAQPPGLPAELRASLAANGLPRQVLLRRGQGSLKLEGSPQRYSWSARALPLEGLLLTAGARATPGPLGGLLGGQGSLDLQPLAMQGRLTVERPVLLQLQGQRLSASGQYRQQLFRILGAFQPLGGGSVAFNGQGRRGGALRAGFEGRALPLSFFEQLSDAWPQLQGAPAVPRGRAAELGNGWIANLGGTLDQQLAALDRARQRLNDARLSPLNSPRFHPEDLRGLVDADLTLQGPSLRALRVDLAAKAHLWQKGDNQDEALLLDPLLVTVRGPLGGGTGRFGIEGLPLSLLALLTPVPRGLRGALDLRGDFRLAGAGSGFSTSVALRQGSLNDTPLRLEQGELQLGDGKLAFQASLRGGDAENSVDLIGTVPLDPAAEGLRLRLSSRGDGLRFLNELAASEPIWRQGSADLELLVRGSRLQPVANGFLRFRDGGLLLAGQQVRDLEATILFDFQELLVQEFSARLGERGRLKAAGGLGLFEATDQRTPLAVEISDAEISVPRLKARLDGELSIAGSLLKPSLSGDLQVSRGTINGQQGELARVDADGAVKPVAIPQLVEQGWDFKQPLLLLGPEVETSTGLALREAIPNFAYLRLSDLRLRFGPDLLVVSPPLASFKTGGLLTLNGPIDRSLKASGVVRLLSGRLSFFTTVFTLDPDAPNVAVFTPSQGLVPFVDIALRTRVSNTLSIGRDRNPISEFDLRGGFTPLDQLSLVRVSLKVSGPADQLADSIELSSNPPLSRDRLVALIGGNTVAGLGGGNATAALATVVGQSLLSPVLSSLGDALGERVSFAVYPSFVTPTISQGSTTGQISRRRVPSQLVLGTELGLDLSQRFNFSVLAAPNRSDIPPQLTLRYQINDSVGLQGSFDTDGRWQTQMQLFLRF
ncbi:translocation/assembly module TamB domain-containing protein [Synechococcus sp. CS-1327]|uniref:translocation/assembly module TamB domain-containing protein n=1 Tax=Synechococcus sp. CS-1327 TaxID=2847977 RepID=UPI0021E1F47A|nr:translocation/assembly module TamB domain-containing protein [Synechococcus sp. CS-1327]MCT0232213.1 translocation/assembly module TamB domain-containing protein [Synechococcus sp. CS-1327]